MCPPSAKSQHPVLTFFFVVARYLVLFNPIEHERLCTVTVLVNTVRVRVLTEDGQTLPVQLSAQWSSGTQMSAEVFEVRCLQSSTQLCGFLHCSAKVLTDVSFISSYLFSTFTYILSLRSMSLVVFWYIKRENTAQIFSRLCVLCV